MPQAASDHERNPQFMNMFYVMFSKLISHSFLRRQRWPVHHIWTSYNTSLFPNFSRTGTKIWTIHANRRVLLCINMWTWNVSMTNFPNWLTNVHQAPTGLLVHPTLHTFFSNYGATPRTMVYIATQMVHRETLIYNPEFCNQPQHDMTSVG